MHVENGETIGFLMLLDLISVVMSEKHFRKGALVIEKYTIQLYSALVVSTVLMCTNHKANQTVK